MSLSSLRNATKVPENKRTTKLATSCRTACATFILLSFIFALPIYPGIARCSAGKVTQGTAVESIVILDLEDKITEFINYYDAYLAKAYGWIYTGKPSAA